MHSPTLNSALFMLQERNWFSSHSPRIGKKPFPTL